MARADIIVSSGPADGVRLEHQQLHEENAIAEGYKRFKQIIDERADSLLSASVKRDFDDNMTINIVLMIGPKPFWSDEYLKEHKLGQYAYEQ